MVSQIGDGASAGGTARHHFLAAHQQGGHEAGEHQHDAHDERRRGQQLARGANAAFRNLAPFISLFALHPRHHQRAGFETAQSQRQLGEDDGGSQDHCRPVTVQGQARPPVGEEFRMPRDLNEAAGQHHQVQKEKGDRHGGGEHDGLAKPHQEDDSQQGEQEDRHAEARVAEVMVQVGIVHGMLGGVGGRERHGDDEVRARESQQDQHENLALPSRQEVFEHGDGTLPGVGPSGHLRVNRQGSQQRDDDQDERCHRRQHSRCHQRNPRLIAQRREVIDARQPDHHVPGLSLLLCVLLAGHAAVKKPAAQRALGRSSVPSGKASDGGFKHKS